MAIDRPATRLFSAIGIAVGCVPLLFACSSDRAGERSVAELVATTRWIEPRLSLDDQSQVCAARLATLKFCRKRKAVDDRLVEQIARREHSLGTHERALFHLVRGSDSSIPQLLLERHIAGEETSAAAWNDLAASLIVGASGDHDWRSYESAIVAVEKALELDATYGRALFNRALVLGKLSLSEQAVETWSAFAAQAADRPWSEEAEDRVSRLEAPPPEAFDFPADIAQLGADQLEKLAAERPSEIRRFLTSEPGFLRAFLADVSGFCRDQVSNWLVLGEAVLDEHGDAFLVNTSRWVCTPKARTVSVLEGIERLAWAIRWHDESESGLAATASEDAERLLQGTDSPLADLALILRASALLSDPRRGASESLLSPNLERIGKRYPWLGAWGYRTLGTLKIRSAENESAIEYFDKGMELLQDGGRDPERNFDLRALAAEARARAGQYTEAWRQGLDALREARDSMQPGTLSALCEHLALIAAESRAHRLQELYSDCSIRHLAADENPGYVASAFIARAEARIALRNKGGAEEDLNYARMVTMTIEDSTKRQQLLAYVGLNDGLNKVRTQPAEAVKILVPVKHYFKSHRNYEHETAASAGIVDAQMALGDIENARSELDYLGKLVADAQRAASTTAYALPIHQHYRSVVERRIRLTLTEGDEIGALRVLIESKSAQGMTEQASSKIVNDIVTRSGGEATLALAWLGDEVAGWLIDDTGLITSYLKAAPEARTLVARAAGTDRIPLPHGKAHALTELHKLLIGPIAGELHQYRTLRVVPDGLLFGIPFPALRNAATNRYLTEEVTLVISPELIILPSRLDDNHVIESVAVFASPAFDSNRPLHSVQSEVETITDLFDSTAEVRLFADDEATVENFLEALENHDLLHFGGHGEVDLNMPLRSRLVLHEASEVAGSSITARQLYDSDAGSMPQLIVLAACDTAAYTDRLPHALALVRPLLELGAREVVGSLRPIPDDTYLEMMTLFYRELRQSGDAAGALRSAQIEMAGSASAENPGHWAYVQIYRYF